MKVKYPRAPVKGTEGQTLTLKCTAEYEKEQCGNILVFWCLEVSTLCQPLTDPDRYLIHINETKIGGNRTQDAFIKFTQLTLNNTGFYQCKAECQRSGASSVGYFINVTVTGMSFVNNN